MDPQIPSGHLQYADNNICDTYVHPGGVGQHADTGAYRGIM